MQFVAGSTTIVSRIATSNIALTGSVSVDGATATNASLVLAAGQTTSSQNGVYRVNTSGAWTKLNQPSIVIATAGNTLINSQFYLSAANTYHIVVGGLG